MSLVVRERCVNPYSDSFTLLRLTLTLTLFHGIASTKCLPIQQESV